MTDGERDPLERALTDAAFLARFTDAYRREADPSDALRWLRNPDADGSGGQPGPGAAVQAARVALFRPGAGDRQRQEHARLVEALTMLQARTLEALEKAARPDARGLRPTTAERTDDAVVGQAPRRGRPRALALGGLALALVLGVAGILWVARNDRTSPVMPPTSDASLADLVSAHRQQLPATWRTGMIVSSSDQLDGELALLTQAGDQGPLLLVVRCPSVDLSFQAVVSGSGQRTVRYGTCGRLQTIALPQRSQGLVEVVVTTRGTRTFSGALVRPGIDRAARLVLPRHDRARPRADSAAHGARSTTKDSPEAV